MKEVYHTMRQYWPLRNKLAMVDGIVMKGNRIVIPFQFHNQILQQMHSNYMGIEKMRLLAHESVYWLI